MSVTMGRRAFLGAALAAGALGASAVSAVAAQSTARPRTRALVIIDVQNDFCEGGSLAVAGGAAVARGIADYLQRNARDYGTIVATRDWHIDPGDHFSDTPDFVTSWPVHCVAGTRGAAFHHGLDRHGSFGKYLDAVVSKGEYSAAYSGFEGRDTDGTLGHILTSRGARHIDLVGIATDHCVRATARDGIRKGFSVTVLRNLTAGVAPKTTEQALSDMRSWGVTMRRAS